MDMAEQKLFRPYQAVQLRDLTRYLGQSSEVVLVAPTGAGKTLIIQGLVSNLVNPQHPRPDQFRGAVVVVPQLQIEDGFSVDKDQTFSFEPEEGEVLNPCPLTIFVTDWIKGRDREHEGQTRKKFLSHLRSPRVKGMITTHQAVSLWLTKHLKEWPERLDGRLLVIDEAHLAGEDNKLGQVARLWVKRGGKVLYATATPWRADGKLVAPDNGYWAVRTLAEHIEGGQFAPGKLEVRTHLTNLRADTAAQVAGDKLGEGDIAESSADIVRLWIEDGCPKAVINVPLDARSQEWAQALEETFLSLKNPPRVHNAVGQGNEVAQALKEALKGERAVDLYQDSRVDVFIACRRFELGTDWKLCSHVYSIGLTSSFSRILQMLGRALRDKKDIVGYPAKFVGLARFTFLIAQSSMEAWADYFQRHTDHSYLLAIFMQDRETGQSLLREVSRELGGHGPRPGTLEARVSYRETVRKLLNILRLDEAETRLVVKNIVHAELELEQKGVNPTNEAVLVHLAARGTDQETIDTVVRFYGHQGAKRFKAAVARGMKALADGCPSRIIRRDLQGVFDAALKEFKGERSIVRKGAFQHLAELSGHRAIEIADLMRDRLGEREILSLTAIDKAIRAYAKDHDGMAPNQNSGDATIYFGHRRNWAAVNGQLRHRGSSLPKRAIDLGIEVDSHNYDPLANVVIDEAIRAYAKDHEGKAPRQDSGDATVYFNHRRTWASVNGQLSNRGSSLPKRAIDLGIEAPSRSYKLTDEVINKAIRAYAKDHGGKTPGHKSGDATKYFDHSRTWSSIAKQLLDRGSSLSNRALELGVEIYSRNYELTDEVIDEAIRAYAREHGGRAPQQNCGDATKYFGHPRNWASVDNRLRVRKTSLPKRAIKLGIEVARQNYNLTDEVINEAIRTYAQDHDGKAPNQESGDATKYFGHPRRWLSVSLYLNNQGSNLSKRATDLGVKGGSRGFKLTDEIIDGALRAYAKDHGGRAPHQKSGDATKYFGHQRTWETVDDILRNRGGSSLVNRSIDLGFEVHSYNYKLTDEIIDEAIRSYARDHKGKAPTVNSGNAEKYFGHLRKWMSVNARLNKRGTSLSKRAKQVLSKQDAPATAHDFSACPKKQATRDETLRIVRERSPFWQGGKLACDWLELAGGPDQTVLMLEGALSERGRYLGISNDPEVVEMNRRLYGHLEHVEWVEDDILTAIGAADKRTRYERVGVLVYDTEMSLASRNFIRDLQYVIKFAKDQHRRMGAFLLVLNFVERGGKRGELQQGRQAYEEELRKLTKRDVKFTSYRNKHPGVSMLLTRLSWGF